MPLSDITPAAVARFLRGRGTPTASGTVKRSSLAGLYRYAIARGLVAISPLPAHPPKLAPQQTPYVYSIAELQRLLEATAVLDNAVSPLRVLTYRTLLLLLYGSGLRVSEALALRVSDPALAAATQVLRGAQRDATCVLAVLLRYEAPYG